MNLHAELQRIWAADAAVSRLVPIEKVFAGKAPDSYTNRDGATLPLNPPWVVIWSPDTEHPGGTSMVVDKVTLISINAIAATRAEAERIRDAARDLFEDADILLGGLTETFQDISMDSAGELPVVDGLFEFFQRFNVESAISRPRRKRV